MMRKMFLAGAAALSMMTTAHAQPVVGAASAADLCRPAHYSLRSRFPVCQAPTHAAGDATLPNQMLGGWCYSEAQRGYVRKKCADDGFILVQRDGFVTLDVKCKFDRVERRANGVYLVRSTCTDGEEEDDRGPPYTENQEYRIVGKTLTIRVLRVEEVGD
jgi:hypothetical protein